MDNNDASILRQYEHLRTAAREHGLDTFWCPGKPSQFDMIGFMILGNDASAQIIIERLGLDKDSALQDSLGSKLAGTAVTVRDGDFFLDGWIAAMKQKSKGETDGLAAE